MTCEPEVHLSTWNMRFGFCVYLLQIARTVYSRVVLVSGECRVSGVRARELGAPNKHRGRRAACAFAGFRAVGSLELEVCGARDLGPALSLTRVCLGTVFKLSVVVSPGVGVCGYPVRTGCGHVCGGQDLQTHFFILILRVHASACLQCSGGTFTRAAVACLPRQEC